MAWRISKQIISGEIDNRIKGRVTGFLELMDGGGRINLDLVGNARLDLAGALIRFTNPHPEAGLIEKLASEQLGCAGTITASRRVKDLLVPVETFYRMNEEERAKAFCWANCLYLEWYGPQGRIVVEGPGYQIEWLDGPHWIMTDEDLQEQDSREEQAMKDAFNAIDRALVLKAALEADEDGEDRPPDEVAMDAEMARMDLLGDRISRRLEKAEDADWDKIYLEESARLRRERGETELPPLSYEELNARDKWMDEINAIALAAEEDVARDQWKAQERRDHALVRACHDFAVELRKSGILPEGVSNEHPLWEIADGVLIASGKLAGALNGCVEDGDWPPDKISAVTVLAFLKKARSYLRDALRGLDVADEAQLVSAEWRGSTRARINRLIESTQQLIMEARESLR